MMVGTKAIATLSTGYLNALDFAKERVQGADLTQAADKTAPRVTITAPPGRPSVADDAEGVRRGDALAGPVRRPWQDRVMVAEHAGERDELAMAVNDLLPIVKGYGSERSWVPIAADAGRFGLPDRLPDRAVRPRREDRHALRRHHGIQGQDFFFRKIVQRTRAVLLGHLAKEIETFIASEAGNGRLKVERELLATASRTPTRSSAR